MRGAVGMGSRPLGLRPGRIFAFATALVEPGGWWFCARTGDLLSWRVKNAYREVGL